MRKSAFTVLFILFFAKVFSGILPVEYLQIVGDNKTNNTQAIQQAIDSYSAAGGGEVVLQKGVYLSGTLQLKNNVTLRINTGAVLKAIEDTAAIRLIRSDVTSRMDVVPRKAFIHANSQQNVKICGGGTIDGSGDAACFSDNVENSAFRHYGLHFVNCSNVSVENVSLKSSAFWMQRYFNCSHVRVHNVNVYNHANRNNDGLDIDSSNDVIVSDCFIDSSDDAIVIKSEGQNPARNITISNCIIATHASGIKLGTGSVGGYDNIVINNIIIRRSKSKIMKHVLAQWGGLTGIDLLTTDGGQLKNIIVSNVIMEDVLNPIHVRLGNRFSGNVTHQGYGGENVSEQDEKGVDIVKQAVLEDVFLSNIVAENTGPYPIIIAGYKDHPVKRISLKNITVKMGKAATKEQSKVKPNWNASGYPGYGMYNSVMPAYGIVTYYTKGLIIDNLNIIPASGEVRPMQKHYFRK